jgi:triacylglycerol lipase
MNGDTKYPIMLIHGCGFRDRKYFNYWGRITAALEEEGAHIYYGNQDSWGNVQYNAAVIKMSLNKILAESNKDKVNIIAHSEGGLEARYMISSLDMADKVASLTTVATPHHGSAFIDLLCKLPERLFRLAAFFTNPFFRFLGDQNPDFYTTCRQFSTSHMKVFNEQNPNSPSVYYQSYAAVMKNPFSDLFLFWPNLIISLLEGENDGLVTPKSAAWTNFRGVLRGATRRGISHADEVDMRRMNYSKKPHKTGVTDIRQLYIDIVSELKQKGL